MNNDKPSYNDLELRIKELETENSNLKSKQIEISKAKELYLKIFEDFPALIWRSRLDKLCDYFNKTWLDFTGKTMEQEFGNGWAEGVHPEDFDFCLQIYVNAFDKREPFKMDYRLKNKFGEYRWIRDFGRPFYDLDNTFLGYIGSCYDITENKEKELQFVAAKEMAEINEQKIREKNIEIELNNQRLESLLKISQFPTNSIQELLDFALDEAIKLTNSKIGYIYFYNENTKQFILNTWSNEVMKECSVVNPQTVYDLDKTGCWGEAVRQRKPIILNNYQSENPIKKGTPKGHVKLEKFLTIPVIFDNKIVAVAGVANKKTDYNNSDIRQLALLMDNVWKISERLQLIKELKTAKEKAEESDRLKSAFLQNLSHEIRTPLNAICGFSGRLNKPQLSEEKRESFVSIIQNSSNQLLSIISHVLTISALETNQEKVNIDNVCINNIIVDLLAIFKQQSVNQNISLYAKQPLNDKQSEIYTDKTKITQILSNLISNAMKFTHEGFIEFGYNLKNDELEFYVKDSGIGIKQELQEKIFERFGQADLSINRKYGGTGLGLAISKGFAELLGGEIWVNSEIGKGATFYFTIPYKPVNEPVNKIDSNQETQKQTNSKPTILVAEDEEFNFLYIEELLIDFDYKLIHAKDGQETIDIVNKNPDISLILMDIKMPIMDGHTAAKIIKEQKPEMLIIAQSAYALEHEIEKYSGIFDDYLTKPITEDNLIEKVTKYMNNK